MRCLFMWVPIFVWVTDVGVVIKWVPIFMGCLFCVGAYYMVCLCLLPQKILILVLTMSKVQSDKYLFVCMN